MSFDVENKSASSRTSTAQPFFVRVEACEELLKVVDDYCQSVERLSAAVRVHMPHSRDPPEGRLWFTLSAMASGLHTCKGTERDGTATATRFRHAVLGSDEPDCVTCSVSPQPAAFTAAKFNTNIQEF